MKRRSFLSWLLAAPAMPSVAAALPVPLPPAVAAPAIAPVVAAAPQLAALDEIEIRGWVDLDVVGRRDIVEIWDDSSPWPTRYPTLARLHAHVTFDAPNGEIERAFGRGYHNFVIREGFAAFRFQAIVDGIESHSSGKSRYRLEVLQGKIHEA